MTTLKNDALVKPDLELARRIFDLFVLADNSSSMSGLKIAILNQSMRESIGELCNESKQHPDVEFRLRGISFSSEARWHVGPEPQDINMVLWRDLAASGSTATGAALQMMVNTISVASMPRRGLPPVMVLLSDGANTDGSAYDNAIEALNNEPWGAKAVRLSIGIGKRFDCKQLEKFTNHPEVGVLEAKNAVDLAKYIRYATVTATKAASQSSTSPGVMTNNVILPPPPTPATANGNINLQVF